MRWCPVWLPGAAALALVATTVWSVLTLPNPEDIVPSTVVTDRDGRILRAFLSPDQTWRLRIELAHIDPDYLAMLLEEEDKRFYDHLGIDFLALGRALFQAFEAGRFVSGASTITMQTVRLMEPRPRTLVAKFIEAVRAITLEVRLTKQEILELYLTLLPFGGNIQGVRAASLAYFGKEPDHLTPGQAALLVAIPQAPELRRPDRRAATAQRARNRILRRAIKRGVIPIEAGQEDLETSVPTHRYPMPFMAPHLARRLVAAGYKGTISTTIEGTLQARLERKARQVMEGLPQAANLSILVINASTGAVRAHIGSGGFFNSRNSGQIDLARAVRSPGSTLKPLVYGMAIEDGLLDPRSVMIDAPLRVNGYAPANFSPGYLGEVTAAEALQFSLNQPAVQVLEWVGANRMISRLRDVGVPIILPKLAERPGLAVILGGLGTTLEGLGSVYTAFATDGQVRPLHVIVGQELAPPLRLLDPGPAWEIRRILRQSPREELPSLPLSWKTGTSYGYRDAWAIGILDATVIAIWVGRPDGTPSPGKFGRNTAAPILFDVAATLPLLHRLSEPPPPHGWVPMTQIPLPETRAYFPPRPIGKTDLKPKLQIVSPVDGAQVAATEGASITLKAFGGRRPLTWLVNGTPIASPSHQRQTIWHSDGPGFTSITAIDADGNVTRSSVELVIKK